jgi:hypothetical protein
MKKILERKRESAIFILTFLFLMSFVLFTMFSVNFGTYTSMKTTQKNNLVTMKESVADSAFELALESSTDPSVDMVRRIAAELPQATENGELVTVWYYEAPKSLTGNQRRAIACYVTMEDYMETSGLGDVLTSLKIGVQTSFSLAPYTTSSTIYRPNEEAKLAKFQFYTKPCDDEDCDQYGEVEIYQQTVGADEAVPDKFYEEIQLAVAKATGSYGSI